MTQTISHLSEKPWSDYTKADYSIEQWHAACLIHQHDGPPTSKDQCKLPVKTPGGAINKNGVHAAAAALAGARGGVHASATEKSSAAHALIRYYNQMGDKPPPSLLTHSIDMSVTHSGVKGMRWGVRKKAAGVKSAAEFKRTQPRTSVDFKTTVSLRNRKPRELSNKQLQKVNARINLEQNYRRLNPTKIEQGQRIGKGIMAALGTASSLYVLANSPQGKAAIAAGKKLFQRKV